MSGDDGALSDRGKPLALVIGAGPAGLMAAEELARGGARVVLVDRMPSVARKLLMAGKSGLNLTKAEPPADFLSRFSGAAAPLSTAIKTFGPEEVGVFARTLGQETFQGSTGRVYPMVMKASPLVRAWLARLNGQGVEIRTRWRWTGWEGPETLFDTPGGLVRLTPAVTVFAVGGASWRRLGSDGHWAEIFAESGIAVTPFAPANIGFRVRWSDHMTAHFGTPVKGTKLTSGGLTSRGEWIISARGIEGGGIYEISAAARKGAPLWVDFAPDLTEAALAERLARGRAKASMGERLRKAGIGTTARALLNEWSRPLPAKPDALARHIKAVTIPHDGPRPMDEAISTAGGVAWDALDETLMLKARPGIFCAGEMLDWEAPTGGYLITGCLATGRHAGRAAAALLSS